MKRKVDMIVDEIERVRDIFEEDSLGLYPEHPDYDVKMAQIDLCDQFLQYIDNLGKRR